MICPLRKAVEQQQPNKQIPNVYLNILSCCQLNSSWGFLEVEQKFRPDALRCFFHSLNVRAVYRIVQYIVIAGGEMKT